MTDTQKKVKIVFTPSGKRGSFEIGTKVLDAARQLGVDIDSVCGGRAICGRCQINVLVGDFAKHNIHSDFTSVTEISEAEKKYAERRGLNEDRRLSCQSLLKSDAVIDVPASSQVHQQVVRKENESHDIDINPIIKPYYVNVAKQKEKPLEQKSNSSLHEIKTFKISVEEPDMHKGTGDLSRLKVALSEEWGLDNLTCSLDVLQSLQPVLREGEWKVTVAVRNNEEIIAVFPGFKDELFGIAVDVGSTTIAAHLCDLSTGEVSGSAGLMNPQIRFGEDLMSRVSYIMMNEGGEKDLTRVVREAINEIITTIISENNIDAEDILEMTLVGNPIMHHLVLGIDPTELGAAPFALATDLSADIKAKELNLNINSGAYVYVLPCVAGHVGADAAAVLLAEEPFNKDEISLIVDVGTNAEIILGNNQRLLAASSPTGPAFEGAQISSGQRAAPGAIERARIDPETLEPRFKVIGCDLWSDDEDFEVNIPVGGITGICGSGIIEIVAEMFLNKIINQDGKINKALSETSSRIIEDGRTYSYVLHDGEQVIKITQNDIRAIQLAKAALYAGVKLLMHKLSIEKVDRIRLAGAFGSHIDVKYAMALGLIPDCLVDEVSSAGNAAGTGARVTLLDKESRNKLEGEVRKIEKIETAVEPSFQEEFVSAMAIPHKSDDFSNLAKVFNLPKPEQQGAVEQKRKRRRKRVR
ncbi:MAG: drug:proton antiporter [Woeseiaceae bacterium]|nr:drug:proton antiporter [Woeseiaceae bacterium]